MSTYDDLMEHCQLCGAQSIHEMMRDFRGNGIWQCGDCGVQFMNPQYSDRHLAEFYARYFSRQLPQEQRRLRLKVFDWYLSLIERSLPVGNMLDVGCGDGHLLEAAVARGWKVEGYDGDFISTRFLRQHYDLITMHQVLEHLKDPLTYLNKCRELIRTGGYLFVAVPNISAASSNLKAALERWQLRRRRVGSYYDSDHHLFYFTPRVLSKTLLNAGFRVIYSRGCHKVRAGESKLKEFVKRYTWEYAKLNSTFFVIAQKM